jgi:hypothetical protein
MCHLNDREVELFAGLRPKGQFLLKTKHQAKVMNVDLDPTAYWQYTNSPYDNERRDAAFTEYGFEKGLAVLAARAS